MGYPTKYSRQYDFVAYQNANPARPLPADKVNVDLNMVAASTAEIVEFLKGFSRADGALANNSVDTDQLSVSVKAALGDPVSLAVFEGIQADVEASATAAAASAAAAATSVAALNGTSASSVLIGTGPKTFITQAGKQWIAGQFLNIASNAAATNYMHGTVTSYSGTSLVMSILDVGGSGTFSDWNIAISAPRGLTGATSVTGTPTPGHLAVFASTTSIQDGGAVVDTTDPANINFNRGVTGSNARSVKSRLMDRASLFDFIPAAQHAAIQSYSSSYDVSTDLQAAINATIGKNKLFVPYGQYIATASQKIITTSSNTFAPGFWMEGDGGGSTIFDNRVAATTRTETFTPSNGSAIVTISRVAHGKSFGQQFQVVDSNLTVGGQSVDGDWYIYAVPDNDHFQILLTVGATGSTPVSVTYKEVNPLFDIDTTADLKFQQFIYLGQFKIGNFTSPARSTGIRVRRGYHVEIEKVWIDGMTCDGLHLPDPNPGHGDWDGSNQVTVRHCRFENCLRWLANAEMRPGNNELSYLDFDSCSFQNGGSDSGAFAATSGGIRWRGQGLLVRNSYFTICHNTPLFIEGSSGLANMFAVRDSTFENNVRKGPYITGAQQGEFSNIQLYNNDGAMNCTVSNGAGVSAGVVTAANSNFTGNRPFLFGGTAAPAPAVLGTVYYARATNLTANSFEFSATPGGAAILTTSSGTAVTISFGVATAGIEIDGANFVVSNVRVRGVTLRATAGNNPYTAFMLSGANADGSTCRVDLPSVAAQNFNYAGQTLVTGWGVAASAPIKYLSGSGSHVPSTGAKSFKVRMVGPGGGGAGSGTTPGSGGTGTSTTFGALTATAGPGAVANVGGVGAAATGGDWNQAGATGQNGSGATTTPGGHGGISAFGGAGWGGVSGGGTGKDALANSGSGGGGGGVSSTINGGGGGASGAYLEKTYTAPFAASYAWAVPAGGAAGTAGTGGAAGGAGASGLILIDESF